MSSREKVQTWRAANPERNREINRLAAVRRRARLAGTDPTIAVADYLARRIRRMEVKANPLSEKRCTKCGETKPIDSFEPRKQSVDGRDSNCRSCHSEVRNRWAKRNRTKLAAQARKRFATSEAVKENGRARRRRRRARMAKVATDLTPDQWTSIKEAYGHRCAYCHREKPLTQDHVVPISKGGAHTASNIVPACRSCNSSKQAAPPQVVFQPHLIQ